MHGLVVELGCNVARRLCRHFALRRLLLPRTLESARDPDMAAAGRSTKTEFRVYGETFRIDSKYEPVKALGKGAYGVVW